MLNQNYFYHGCIRRYTAIFGSMFNDIRIRRKKHGSTEEIRVPLRYSAGHAYFKKNESRGIEIETRFRRILPAIGYELVSLEPDLERKTNSQNKLLATRPSGDFQFNRVPYNLNFSVFLKSKNMDEMLQMVEQILPHFSPMVQVRINELPNENIEVEQIIPIVLTGIEKEDNWEGPFEETRIMEWTLNFTLKGFLYKETKSGYVVEQVQIESTMANLDEQMKIMTIVDEDETSLHDGIEDV